MLFTQVIVQTIPEEEEPDDELLNEPEEEEPDDELLNEPEEEEPDDELLNEPEEEELDDELLELVDVEVPLKIHVLARSLSLTPAIFSCSGTMGNVEQSLEVWFVANA